LILFPSSAVKELAGAPSGLLFFRELALFVFIQVHGSRHGVTGIYQGMYYTGAS
jgi:hypothetical protein